VAPTNEIETISRSGSPKKPERRLSKSPRPFSPLDDRKIANIVIAKNLNRASPQVQVQALEVFLAHWYIDERPLIWCSSYEASETLPELQCMPHRNRFYSLL
jgi:hypothetical protein